MANVGNIWITLKARTEEATNQMKSAFGQMGSMALKLGGMFAGMSFLKGAVEQANTLNEQMNALSVRFGDATKQLTNFGQTSAKQFGLSKTEVLSYANEFSGLLEMMGKGPEETVKSITDLQARISDLGSFSQRSFSEIADGLQSALAGRASMTLQQLGIFLNETDMQAQVAQGAFADLGISADTSFSSLDRGTQVMLRMNSFMKQTQKATGDYSRTLGTSFENQQKLMKANFQNIQIELGQKLLPTLIKVFSWLNDHLNQVIATLGVLGGMFAGFKLGKFVGEMIKGIALLMGFASAKVAAQTGIGAIAAVPAMLGAVGGIIGGILGGVGLSMGSSGAGSSNQGTQVQGESQISLNVNIDSISGQSQVASNSGVRVNMQTNMGRGGN